MITREFSMHEDAGGIIRLCQVLATVPANTWRWSMLDYEGCRADSRTSSS